MKHKDCIMPVYASLSDSNYCVYQWTSGSVDYHGYFRPWIRYPTCGAYSDKSKKWRERVFRCHEDFHLARAYSLCEDKPTERGRRKTCPHKASNSNLQTFPPPPASDSSSVPADIAFNSSSPVNQGVSVLPSPSQRPRPRVVPARCSRAR